MFNWKNLTDFFKIVKKKYLGNQYESVPASCFHIDSRETTEPTQLSQEIGTFPEWCVGLGFYLWQIS